MKNVFLAVILVFASQIPQVSFAAHWYVNKAASCAGTTANPCNGTDWNHAWKEMNQIAWSSVKGGDTVWLAGGNYTTGMTVSRGDSSSTPITITRVSSDPNRTQPSIDAVALSAAGWSAAYDARVVVASSGPLRTPTSNVIIDGRIDMGIRFSVTNGGGLPTSCDVTGGNNITLKYLDLTGPNAVGHDDGSSCGTSLVSFNGDSSGMMIGYGYVPNPGADNITVSHCRVRGHPNEFWFAGARNITIEHSKIYDNGAANSTTWHGNVMIVNGSDGIVFRHNEVYNWQTEGLYPWGSVSKNWYVYGNIFHDGMGGKNGNTHRFFEIRSYSGTVTHGPMYVYNNTVTNAWAGFVRGDTSVYWSSDSVARNNLFWNLANAGVGYTPATASNNIYAGSDPFVGSGSGNFNILSTISANLPRDKGVAVANVNGHDFSVDRNGTSRGEGSAWDIGALEYKSTASGAAPAAPSALRVQ